MKRVIFTKKDFPYNLMVEGYSFTYAGLKLVLHKECINSKWWKVYEYSTGYDLGSRCSGTTRKDSIASAQKMLDRLGSLRICQGIQEAISRTGILTQQTN